MRILTTIKWGVAAAMMMSSVALAQQRFGGCNFTDSFLISGPVGSKILSLSASPAANVRKLADQEFQIWDHCSTSGNITVHAMIGTDAAHSNELVIEDGQVMMNPEVVNSSAHGGYYYAGTDHELYTYLYTLKFAQQ